MDEKITCKLLQGVKSTLKAAERRMEMSSSRAEGVKWGGAGEEQLGTRLSRAPSVARKSSVPGQEFGVNPLEGTRSWGCLDTLSKSGWFASVRVGKLVAMAGSVMAGGYLAPAVPKHRDGEQKRAVEAVGDFCPHSVWMCHGSFSHLAHPMPRHFAALCAKCFVDV